MKVTTPKFRVGYCSVFETSKVQNEDTGKYECTMIFPKDADLSALKEAAETVAREKWGNKLPKGLMLPFNDGDNRDHEAYENTIYVNSKTQTRPGLVDKDVNPIMDQADFYSGCYARATVNAYAWEYSGKKGISFGLNNLQKLDDGEAIGQGRSKPEDDFAPVQSAKAEETKAKNEALFG